MKISTSHKNGCLSSQFACIKPFADALKLINIQPPVANFSWEFNQNSALLTSLSEIVAPVEHHE